LFFSYHIAFFEKDKKIVRKALSNFFNFRRSVEKLLLFWAIWKKKLVLSDFFEIFVHPSGSVCSKIMERKQEITPKKGPFFSRSIAEPPFQFF